MNTENKMTWIESLRGIAAILIFVSHLRFINGSQGGFIIGRIGVVLFFFMSGYLALGSRKRKTKKQYFFNRFCRMYPVYWVLLSLTFLLGCTLDTDYSFSIKDLILNLTLFHEFLGSECIIGASWMMPIQVCFFVAITIFAVEFWTLVISVPYLGIKFHVPYIVMTALALFAIFTGYLRYRTGIPFPSAFFLLLSIAFLGMYRKAKSGGYLLVVFETGLLITTLLSYQNEAILYVIAYNIGIIIFYAAEYHASLHIKPAERLGSIGFTFFLSASAAKIVLARINLFDGSIAAILLDYVAEFILTLLIAIIIDQWVEKPFLRKTKILEKKLGSGIKET